MARGRDRVLDEEAEPEVRDELARQAAPLTTVAMETSKGVWPDTMATAEWVWIAAMFAMATRGGVWLIAMVAMATTEGVGVWPAPKGAILKPVASSWVSKVAWLEGVWLAVEVTGRSRLIAAALSPAEYEGVWLEARGVATKGMGAEVERNGGGGGRGAGGGRREGTGGREADGGRREKEEGEEEEGMKGGPGGGMVVPEQLRPTAAVTRKGGWERGLGGEEGWKGGWEGGGGGGGGGGGRELRTAVDGKWSSSSTGMAVAGKVTEVGGGRRNVEGGREFSGRRGRGRLASKLGAMEGIKLAGGMRGGSDRERGGPAVVRDGTVIEWEGPEVERALACGAAGSGCLGVSRRELEKRSSDACEREGGKGGRKGGREGGRKRGSEGRRGKEGREGGREGRERGDLF